jgi:hypothetical protein
MLLSFILPILGASFTASPVLAWQDRPPINEPCPHDGQPEIKISDGTAADAIDRSIAVNRFLDDCFGKAMESVLPIEYLVDKDKDPVRAAIKSRSNAEAANRLVAWVEPRNGHFTILVVHNTPDEPMCFIAAGIISDGYIDKQVAKCWRALQPSRPVR